MIFEIVAGLTIFAAGYKWGSTVRAAALKDLQQAEASAEAELADLKAKIAFYGTAVVSAGVAEVKAAL